MQGDITSLKADVGRGLGTVSAAAVAANANVALLVQLERVKTRMEAACSTLKVGTCCIRAACIRTALHDCKSLCGWPCVSTATPSEGHGMQLMPVPLRSGGALGMAEEFMRVNMCRKRQSSARISRAWRACLRRATCRASPPRSPASGRACRSSVTSPSSPARRSGCRRAAPCCCLPLSSQFPRALIVCTWEGMHVLPHLSRTHA